MASLRLEVMESSSISLSDFFDRSDLWRGREDEQARAETEKENEWL